MTFRSWRLLAPVAALAVAACSGPAPVADPFQKSGELIALSGGNAGAARACVACHGLEGQGDGNLTPRLAGLDPGYIVRQLTFYADGLRQHKQMSAIADRLSVEDRAKVAAYYAALPPATVAECAEPVAPAVVALYLRGDPARGIESCASCHGADGAGTPGNPPLAGQPAPYLEQQLRDWRWGRRYGDPLGVMTRIARALTPAELAALPAHAQGLPGGFGRPAPPATCPPARRGDPRNGA